MATRKSRPLISSTRWSLEQPWAQHGGAAGSQEPHRHSGPIRILRLRQVLHVTGLGKTKVYDLQSEGRFPMRVQITEHSVGWIEDEVQAWLGKRVATRASMNGAPNALPSFNRSGIHYEAR